MTLIDRWLGRPRPRVIKAVVAGDVAAVQAMLAQGADPNRAGTYRQDHVDMPDICGLPIVRQSPLEAAYDMGSSAVPPLNSPTRAIMDALVKAGARVNTNLARQVTAQLELELKIQRNLHPEGYVDYVRSERFTSFLSLLDEAGMPWTDSISWRDSRSQVPMQVLSEYLETKQLTCLTGGASWVAEHRPTRPPIFNRQTLSLSSPPMSPEPVTACPSRRHGP